MKIPRAYQTRYALAVTGIVGFSLLAGCSPSSKQTASTPAPSAPGAAGSPPAGANAGKKTLVLAAYSIPKEAYQQAIIPAFQKYWKDKTGQDVEFSQTYEASGTQARNIVNGLEADVAALSLEGDIEKIRKAGLITHNWKAGPFRGMVTESVVALATRAGNPKGIRDWADLTKPGVEVLTPNPDTSGGAKWNVLAIYGAGLGPHRDAAAAEALLRAVRKNVTVMDKSGRESFGTFSRGVGDVAITYENEALRAIEGQGGYTLVIPPATILIESPVAVVDKNADKHGVRDVADAFVQFLFTDDAQRAFAQHHFRPVQPKILREFATHYPEPARVFTVAGLGGWAKVDVDVFGPSGAWKRAANPAPG